MFDCPNVLICLDTHIKVNVMAVFLSFLIEALLQHKLSWSDPIQTQTEQNFQFVMFANRL